MTQRGPNFYCVLDFEATCDDNQKIQNQEIIEFPVVVLDGATYEVVAEFHKYVRPVWNPTLSKFCTGLTGIEQATVDAADPFPKVFAQLKDFLDSTLRAPHPSASFTFVTCGDWDLKTMLPAQCSLSGLDIPLYFQSWINIKIAFADFFKRGRPMGMTDMLQGLRIPLVGRHHSGIDDARNIASVLVKMLQQGYVGANTFPKSTQPRSAPQGASASRLPQGAPVRATHAAAPKLTDTDFPSLSDSKGKGKVAPPQAMVTFSSSAPVFQSPQGKGKGREVAGHQQGPGGNHHGGGGRANQGGLTDSPYDATQFRNSHLIDIGANLAHKSFDRALPSILTRSLEGGVRNIVTLGTSVHSSLRCQSICKQYAGHDVKLSFTAGVHPHDAKTCTQDTIAQLMRMASDPNMVAIGECGLDFDRNFSAPEVQEFWFEEQIKLAIRLNKPLYLHERSAHSAFVRILSKHQEALKNIPVVVHCFTGPEAELRKYVEMGLYIGITGWVCDGPRGVALRDALPSIPLDKLMIETDAPFLVPKNIRPRPSQNEPFFLGRVAETVALCTGHSVNHIIEVSTRNALKFFSLVR